MSGQEQLLMEPKHQAQAPGGISTSGIKTILMHVQNDETLDSRLQNALSLARCFEAHLSCLHVTPIQAYVAFDSFGGVFVMQDVMDKLERQETDLRARVEQKLSAEDVSWDYERSFHAFEL